MANHKVQKSIANSKSMRFSYACTERDLSLNYSMLLDIQLRTFFKALSRDDFAKPEQFNTENGSPAVKQYLETRAVFEHFITSDIQDHSMRDSQVHAFRRWIHIAEQLLKSRNYEAAVLVICILLPIKTRLECRNEFKFQKELPACSYERLEDYFA